MRLVCPNCDAEYEVDASAIPDSGRDVQCSNCGHGWFQMPPHVEEELAAEEALFDPPPPPPPTPHAEPLPRALDEGVLSVLREEAARETSARRAEAPQLETQGDLGLTAAVAAAVAAAAAPVANPPADLSSDLPAEPDPVAERIARMKGQEPVAAAKPQSRREMLPEIDEINTTLRASSERRSGEAGAVADSLDGRSGSSSFRTGFMLMILLGLAIVLLYVMAPKLADQIPALRGALEGYVAAVDAVRLWLDGLLRAATGAMKDSAP